MEAKEAEKRGIEPLGIYRGMMVAGCGPEEMGIGPVFAVPKLLKAHGLKIDDIGLWELNEAFASQAIYCRDTLGIDPEIYNVNGRRDIHRPPLRHVWRSYEWPRTNRRQKKRCKIRGCYHVYRWRHGWSRIV